MFIVFNKQKVYSYLVAFSTVVILFAIGFSATNKNTVVTSTPVNNIIDNNEMQILNKNE